jgi:3-methyladenine DNA glycosylase AlkC
MPFADDMIGSFTARRLMAAVQAAVPQQKLTHLRQATDDLAGGGLRERADLLRDALLADLPGSYEQFAGHVRCARDRSGSFSGWLIWPVTSAVALKAIEDGSTRAFDDAMGLLAELTGRLTSEFAIRLLLRHDPDRALQTMTSWSSSPDVDVRRLASEGSRPYLPWAARVPTLITRPGLTITILQALHQDDSEYVRRSVANHLNDISRDHPQLAVATAAQWLVDADRNTPQVVRRALRTLVKRGDAGALALLGFTHATVEITGPTLDRTTVPLGGSIVLQATIRNSGDTPARLAIDYVIYHQKANGGQTGKTFKLTTRTLAPGQQLELSREHSFRPITTRRYYPGPHAIELKINGTPSDTATFELVDTVLSS